MKKRRPLVIDDALIAELTDPVGIRCSPFVTLIRKRLEAEGWSPTNNLFLSAVIADVLDELRRKST